MLLEYCNNDLIKLRRTEDGITIVIYDVKSSDGVSITRIDIFNRA
jgi:hypothetical protein